MGREVLCKREREFVCIRLNQFDFYKWLLLLDFQGIRQPLLWMTGFSQSSWPWFISHLFSYKPLANSDVLCKQIKEKQIHQKEIKKEKRLGQTGCRQTEPKNPNIWFDDHCLPLVISISWVYSLSSSNIFATVPNQNTKNGGSHYSVSCRSWRRIPVLRRPPEARSSSTQALSKSHRAFSS